MALSHVVTSAYTHTAATSHTFNYNADGADVIMFNGNIEGANTVASVTFNSVGFTLLQRITGDNVSQWYLENPAQGVQSLVITYNQEEGPQAGCGGVGGYAGVSTTSAIGAKFNSGTAPTAATSYSTDFTTLSDNSFNVNMLRINGTSQNISHTGIGMTERQESNGTESSSSSGEQSTTVAGIYTISYSWGDSLTPRFGVIELQEEPTVESTHVRGPSGGVAVFSGAAYF